MPVYNCELYVEEAVNSILNQSYTDFEFLIIDDASTDKTIAILKKYEDSRIQLILKPKNTGYTNSLNYGLQIAKGKYIARMDGDDISLPERFAKQLAFLDANPEVVVCGTYYKIIGNDKTIHIPENNQDIKLGLLHGNCLAHPSVMIRKKVLEDFSIVYDTTREPAEDYALWVQLLAMGKLHNLPEVLLQYRLHHTQVSNKRSTDQKRNDTLIKFQLLQYLDLELEPNEHAVLEKIFKRNVSIDFNEMGVFKQAQRKLRVSNTKGFFETKGFENYLRNLEAQVIRHHFLKQKSYSFFTYFNYLKAKIKWNLGLTLGQELKLMIKVLIFRKVG